MIKEIDSAIISEEIKLKMGEHACEAYPSECCGILFGKYEDDDIIKIIDLKNGKTVSHEYPLIIPNMRFLGYLLLFDKQI